MEIKRSLNSNLYIFAFGSVLLSFVLGYILLVSIDKVETVTIRQFYFSSYTVFTQFGPMIFSIIAIHFFNTDYKEKNILFLKHYGNNPITLFLKKFAVLLLWFSLSLIVCLLGFSLIISSFQYFFIVLIYIFNALFYIVLISLLFGFLFKNMLMAYCVNLLVWVSSIILTTIFPIGNIIGYYDASNKLYANFEQFLETGTSSFLSFYPFLYNCILLSVALLLVITFRKRWLNNGI